MQIQLINTGKRFNREWIFRNCNYTFSAGTSYAITGPNGSGKSTLLQTIAGAINASEGSVAVSSEELAVNSKPSTVNRLPLTVYQAQSVNSGNGSSVNGKRLTVNNEILYQHLSIAAPYLELVEEMTATEALTFHAAFKPLLSGISIKEILEIVGLKAAADKQIRFYSSGMKQRMKLAQAIFSDVPILLLDEPCTNLDAVGYALYHQLIKDYCTQKLVIVCSNDVHEYDFCTEKLDIMDYKPRAKN